MNKINVYEVRRIKHPEILTDVIHQNFIYLTKFPELMHTKNDIFKLLTDDNNIIYLVYNNKNLIGYLVGEMKNVSNRYVFYISYIYVMEKYRNKKIGSYLMNKAINYCHQNGIKFIILTCDTYDKKIIEFYTKKYKFIKDPELATNNRHEVFCLYIE